MKNPASSFVPLPTDPDTAACTTAGQLIGHVTNGVGVAGLVRPASD
jgi:hypothetical protein